MKLLFRGNFCVQMNQSVTGQMVFRDFVFHGKLGTRGI